MALMHLNFRSKYLSGSTDVNVLLPDMPTFAQPGPFYGQGKKYPVLWLLHGTFGDYSDWVRHSNIELYAAEKELIVVMPSAHNTDYANWPGFGTGYNAFDYLTEELMPLVYGWFPASDRREDNFIAGLSMGGRGACAYAFANPEKFAGMYSMSCVPQDIRPAYEQAVSGGGPDTPWTRLDNERTLARIANAGGLEGYLASPQNTWDRTALLAGREDLPRLIFSCGTADFMMYEKFKAYRDYARRVGLKAEFRETEGYNHEWRLWEKDIQTVLETFFPAAEKAGNEF